jgi:large subunit ribosomal protein L24
MKLKIKKGDLVKVISGNDKGNTGRVLDINAEKMRILVEGVNIRKKHQRPSQSNQKGGIVSKEMPIHYSNVMVLDSEKHATRIGIKFDERGDKKVPVRYARTNSADL